jgi:hypothetical protein
MKSGRGNGRNTRSTQPIRREIQGKVHQGIVRTLLISIDGECF